MKLIDHLPDQQHGIFSHESLANFKDVVTIRYKLIQIEQKAHLFKQVIGLKLERL